MLHNSGGLTPCCIRCPAGVLLYVICSGKLPFEEVHLSTLFYKISRAKYNRPPWFSEELISILDLMLQPEPRDR